MTVEKLKPPMPKGGRPVGAKDSFPRSSKLGSILKALREMEPDALKNIEESLKKKDIDKEVVATSKWLVSTIVSVSRAIAASKKPNITVEGGGLQSPDGKSANNANVVNFSTKIVEYKYEDEEDE